MNLFEHSTNAEYHANRSHLSSSTLKQLLHNPEQFHQEWILGNKPPEQDQAKFSEGSFVHSLILEPEKISQYAIFPGLRKQGAEYESFKAANPGKTILSMPQVNRCETLARSYQSMPAATALLKTGLAEHSMTGTVLGVPVKARADWIDPDRGVLVDVKTTALMTDIDLFRGTVEQFSYELSAALYCEIAYQTYGKIFDWYWLVLSKDDKQCAIYKASSDTLSKGSAMVTKAIVKYKQCLKTGIWSSDAPKIDYSTSEYEILEV